MSLFLEGGQGGWGLAVVAARSEDRAATGTGSPALRVAEKRSSIVLAVCLPRQPSSRSGPPQLAVLDKLNPSPYIVLCYFLLPVV